MTTEAATRPASADEQDTHVAVCAIDAEIARLKRERDALLAPVREQMEADGTTALVDDETGQALYRLDAVERTEIDRSTLREDFPEAWLKVTSTVNGTRFSVRAVKRAAARTAVAA